MRPLILEFMNPSALPGDDWLAEVPVKKHLLQLAAVRPTLPTRSIARASMDLLCHAD
jgi:hypothetical protein